MSGAASPAVSGRQVIQINKEQEQEQQDIRSKKVLYIFTILANWLYFILESQIIEEEEEGGGYEDEDDTLEEGSGRVTTTDSNNEQSTTDSSSSDSNNNAKHRHNSISESFSNDSDHEVVVKERITRK